MLNSRRALGQLGEDLAVRYLAEAGYVVLQRNYRCLGGEIDVVAMDDQRLAFVEVRTRRGDSFGTAKESVSCAKQKRLAAVARSYLQENDLIDVDWGIDVLALQLTADGAVRSLELIRNAVSEEA